MKKALFASVASAALLAFAAPAFAGGMPMMGAGGAPGGTPTVPTGAVTFPAGTIMSLASALSGVSDSGLVTAVFTVRGTPSNSTYGSASPTLLNGDLLSNISAASSEAVPGLNTSFDNSGGNYGTLRFNLNDATGGAGHQCNTAFASALTGDGLPHTYILEANTSNTGSTAKNTAIYIDGVKVAGGCTGPSTSAFAANFSNALGFSIGKPVGSDPNMTFDLSNVFVKFGAADVDTSNNLSGGAIAKFYNIATGAPADLGTGCANPFGSADLCYRGGASTFATNIGTAGVLSVTNGTVGVGLQDAWLQPGITPPAHTAYVKFALGENTGSGIATVTTNSAGRAIASGDLLIEHLHLIDTSNTTGNHNPACTAGFTPVYVHWDNGTNNDPTNDLVCDKIAGGSETGSYTMTWTTNNTRGSAWSLYDIGNANGTTPIDPASTGAVSGGTSSTTSCAAPALTGLVNSTDTLLTIWAPYFPGGTSSSGLKIEFSAMSASQVISTGSSVLAATSSTTKTFTMTNGECQAISIAINGA